MQRLPENIYDIATVREMDRIAIEELGIDGYVLMTRAAEAALQVIGQRWPDASRWLVVCGPGNNGGDGYVVARLARAGGTDVAVVSLADPERLTGDAQTAYRDYAREGGEVLRWQGELDSDADLIVDALFGSGLARPVEGDYAVAVEAINAHSAPVHALDIASGINGDDGAVMGDAVRAAATTAFVGLKPGLLLGEGLDYCGDISFSDLGIPRSPLVHLKPVLRSIGEAPIRDALAPRRKNAHKGDFGHVLIIGGGEGMPGAARLCGEAALRAGAGRVSLATHPSHAAVIAANRPELMSHAVSDTDDLTSLIEAADVLAVGPGLGTGAWARQIFNVVRENRLPCVWDADALNLLAAAPFSANHRIVTPHPGEAARLLNSDTRSVQRDRLAALRSLTGMYGGVAVLKGAGTLVGCGDDVPRVCLSGNPGMAAPGMGDVLTGIIAALLAQGATAPLAAAAGVELHARAGDVAAEWGLRGMIASDLVAALRRVLRANDSRVVRP